MKYTTNNEVKMAHELHLIWKATNGEHGRQLVIDQKMVRFSFRGLDLDGATLKGDFENCTFTGASLVGADITGARFSGGNFANCKGVQVETTTAVKFVAPATEAPATEPTATDVTAAIDAAPAGAPETVTLAAEEAAKEAPRARK